MSIRKAWLLLGIVVAVALVAMAALVGCGKTQQAASPAAPAATSTAAAAPAAAPGQAALRVWLPCGLSGWVGKFDKIVAAEGPGPNGQGPNGKEPKLEFEIVNSWGLADRLKKAQRKPDLIIMPGDRELLALQKEGLLDGAPVAWALNQMAVLTPKANPAKIESVSDLAKVTKLVMAPDTTSQGYYARQALQKAGLLDKLKGKIVTPPTPADVYAVLAKGEAEAGLSYAGCSLPPQQEGVFTPETAAKAAASTETDEQQAAGATPAPGQQGAKASPPGHHAKVIDLGPVPARYLPAFPATAAVAKGAQNAALARQVLQELVSSKAQDQIANWMPAAAHPSKATSGRISLSMYCGAGIRPPVEQLANVFEKAHPKVRLDISYAGSGCLLARLTFAKSGDLYMPGEGFYLDQAGKRGFLLQRQHIAYFVPIILVAKGNPKDITEVGDFLRPDVTGAIGDPDACAGGRVAKQIFQKVGIWKKASAKIRRRAMNIPELAYWVSIGTVDAAVVWQAQGKQFSKNCDSVAIPSNTHKPVDISIALLKFTKHPALAKEFMALLASPEGQKVFKEQGYGLKPE